MGVSNILTYNCSLERNLKRIEAAGNRDIELEGSKMIISDLEAESNQYISRTSNNCFTCSFNCILHQRVHRNVFWLFWHGSIW